MSNIPLDRFSPSADPVAAWRDWAAHLAPLFEARPQPHTHVEASVGMRSYNLGLLLVGDVTAPANTLERTSRMAAQQGMDHVLIQFYRSGTSTVRTARGETTVGPSDFLVYDLAQPITVSASPVSATNILLPRALLGERAGSVDALHGRAFGGGDVVAHLFASYLRDVVAHADRLAPHDIPGIAEAAAKLCCAAVPNLADEETVVERRTSLEIRAFIQSHLAEAGLGPEMICARFGLSRATLYRQFAADDGVQNYIRNGRLARAMRLLTGDGPRPRVSSVAYATGFVDEKTFSRAFKRRYGFLPRDAAADRAAWPLHADAGSMLGDWVRQLGF